MSRFSDLSRVTALLAALAGCGGSGDSQDQKDSGLSPPDLRPEVQSDVQSDGSDGLAPDQAPPLADAGALIDPGPGAGADGPAAPEAGAVAGDDLAFCDSYAATRCEHVFGCSAIRPVGQQVYGDIPTCTERLRLLCRIDAAQVGSGLNQASTSTCMAALGRGRCEDGLAEAIEACQFKGTLAAGVACGTGSQCASGFCRAPETGFCGVCAARAAEGAVCDSDAACELPLLCSEAGRCARPAGEGAFCNESIPCARDTFYCNLSESSCRRFGLEGAACNEGGTAAEARCNRGLICLPYGTVGTCQPERMVPAGQYCGFGSQEVPGIACAASGSCVSNRCLAPGNDGEACTLSPRGDSNGCLPPALCVGGTCRLPDPGACR
jgi:hypothetical protein